MTTRYPRTAFVLAAGFGTRMLPLTKMVPKALLPLWGKPMLAHTLDLLQSWGVRDVVVNMHHKPEMILDFVKGYSSCDMSINLSFEPEILGTGGALRKAEWFVKDDPFWLINADVAADLDPRPLVNAFTRNTLAALWMHPARGPRTVIMKRGHITDFRGSNGYTFCGLHLLSPRILDYLPKNVRFAGIIAAYERALAKGEQVRGVCVDDCYWADLGTPDQYLNAHAEILQASRGKLPGKRLCHAQATTSMRKLKKEGVLINGFAAVAPTANVEPGARLRNTVVFDRAGISAQANLHDAIVGSGTRVTGNHGHMLLPASYALRPSERDALDQLGWKTNKTMTEVLSARGSARTFMRLSQPQRRAMLVRYSLERKENSFYAHHARFLKSLGIPVPAVLLDAPEECFTLLEDMGDRHLGDVLATASPRRVQQLYEKVITHVVTLHERGASAARKRHVPLSAPFSADLLRWERNYFINEYLRGHLGLGEKLVAGARRDLCRVATKLEDAPPVLIHRDLQSSNIMISRRQLALIDFQGMRLGPAAYDIASLLCDPYAMLPIDLQETLLDLYIGHTGFTDTFRETFWWAAMQRLAQALGAYARLGRLPAGERFRQHIPHALQMMDRAMEEVGPLKHLEACLTAR